MFVNKIQENNMPTTIEALQVHLKTFPVDKLPEHVMWFVEHI
jgi:hypothetical protein